VKKVKELVILGLTVTLVLSTLNLLGCGGNSSQKVNPYIEDQMSQLFNYLNDVTSMDPSAWSETDTYLRGDFTDTSKLEKRMNTAMSRYDQVIKYLDRDDFENEEELEAWRELVYLRDYLYLSANYVKIALDLLKKDISEKMNSSKSIVFDIGNFYHNNYNRLFIHEYNRLAEYYGIKEIH
jgi:hypothetical protein